MDDDNPKKNGWKSTEREFLMILRFILFWLFKTFNALYLGKYAHNFIGALVDQSSECQWNMSTNKILFTKKRAT